MRVLIAFCVAYGLCCCLLHAQVADSVAYPEVRVEAARVMRAVGTQETVTDSALTALSRHLDLASLLQLEGVAQVRSYSPGSIATFSIRGTTAAQTQVMWMGIPVNNPMLGISDLSLQPLNGLGGVRLLHGPAAMPHHAGGIGGTIELIESAPLSHEGVETRAAAEWASFGTYSGQLGLRAAKGRWNTATSVSYRHADNDFPYTDRSRKPPAPRTMANARMGLTGVAQSVGFRADSANTLSLHFRLAQNGRQLPPTMLTPATRETLFDRDIWLALRWRRVGQRSVTEATSAYINGRQEYFGNDAVTYVHLYQGWKNIVRWSHRLGRRWELRAGADIISERARSDSSYAQPQWRHWQALFASAVYSPARWARVQALVREDVIDARFSPLQAMLGAEADALRWLQWSANVSRNFRAPGMNDLYWHPGGNPDLRPETGLSMETGLKLHKRWGRGHAELRGTWFRTEVSDWIQWLPTEFAYWSPRNVRKVLATGIEAGLRAGLRLGKVSLSLAADYAYTSSTVRESALVGDASVGKQLIYVPINSVRGHASVRWKGLGLLYGHQWTGARFIATDNTALLPAFHTAWAAAAYRLPLRRHSIEVNAVAENLFDHRYEAVVWRPMPGRSFRVGVVYEFAKLLNVNR